MPGIGSIKWVLTPLATSAFIESRSAFESALVCIVGDGRATGLAVPLSSARSPACTRDTPRDEPEAALLLENLREVSAGDIPLILGRLCCSEVDLSDVLTSIDVRLLLSRFAIFVVRGAASYAWMADCSGEGGCGSSLFLSTRMGNSLEVKRLVLGPASGNGLRAGGRVLGREEGSATMRSRETSSI